MINSKENSFVEIARMQLQDINPVLDLLSETNLEVWKYNDFSEEILRPHSLTMIGKMNEKIVGFCLSRLIMSIEHNSRSSENLKTECEIYNIAVKKEYQNQGIGNKLLNHLVILTKEYNNQAIWLEVRSSNRKAIDFYQKNNFKQIYERKNFYKNPSENAIVMKKDILQGNS